MNSLKKGQYYTLRGDKIPSEFKLLSVNGEKAVLELPQLKRTSRGYKKVLSSFTRNIDDLIPVVNQ